MSFSPHSTPPGYCDRMLENPVNTELAAIRFWSEKRLAYGQFADSKGGHAPKLEGLPLQGSLDSMVSFDSARMQNIP